MRSHFIQFAAYNRWANARLYEAALALDEAHYRRDVGAFFKSLHGTLNHILLGDRIWMARLTGEGPHPTHLDGILFADRAQLSLARADEDERILRFVESLDESAICGSLRYTTTTGQAFESTRADILANLFNHQTHHRGQAHTILSICTGQEPPSLDLMPFLRGAPAPDLRALATR